MNTLTKTIFISSFAALIISCGGGSESTDGTNAAAPQSMMAAKENADPMQNKGIGPIKSLELGEIDQDMAALGKTIYEEKCSACHKATEKYIGPAPVGVLDRRTPEWVMNMILNPEQMVKEDPIAKDLLKQYLSPMANQSLTEDEARKILEYFRTL